MGGFNPDRAPLSPPTYLHIAPTVLACTTSANTPNAHSAWAHGERHTKLGFPRHHPEPNNLLHRIPPERQRDPSGLTTLEGDVACGPPWDASRARTQETRTRTISHTPPHAFDHSPDMHDEREHAEHIKKHGHTASATPS